MIKKLSVVVADIDGTLCLKGQNLMPRTREAIQRLHREGILFGPASGRPFDQRTLDRAKEWELGFDFDFAIGMNGGELYDSRTKTVERIHMLKKEDIKDIISFLEGMDLNAIVYVNGYDEIYALRMDDFMQDSINRNHSHVEIGGKEVLGKYDTGKIEIHIKPCLKERFLKAVNDHKNDRWAVTKTFEMENHITYEFMDPRVNKGLALRKYSEEHQIPLSEFMAFGDMENDITLLQEAGWGVCLLNGSETTKAVAQAVTEYSVFEDGVGNYLFDHWFNK